MLTEFAKGITEEQVWKQHNTGMCSHRAIKDFTAKGGGLAAAIIQLACVAYKDNELSKVLVDLGRFKHSIIQASLDSKNNTFDSSDYDEVYALFHKKEDVEKTTPPIMYKALRKVSVDKNAARTVVTLMFKLPRQTLRESVKEFTPLFYLTRRLQFHNGSELLQPSQEMIATLLHSGDSHAEAS